MIDATPVTASLIYSAGPDGPSVTGGPVGQPGMLSPSTFVSAILVDPGGTFPSSDLAGMLLPAIPVDPIGRWGTLPPSGSDSAGPDGPSVTGGPVGQPGMLSPSTFVSAILVDPGGTFPSSDLARMLLPAIDVRPVGMWGKLSSSVAGRDGLRVTGGPVGHLGTLPPTASESGVLVDSLGMFPSSDLARMRGPAAPAGSPVLGALLALRCHWIRYFLTWMCQESSSPSMVTSSVNDTW